MIDAVVLDRPRYLSRVAPWVGKPLIKVLTGQRRIGKSCLLQTLARTLAAAEPGRPVLHLEMERAEWRSVGDADALLTWVADRAPTGRAAILIDEVQEIHDFDVALRSLATEQRLDLYVTGSNAELLSGEIATRFAGRSITIEVHPLSYDEFLVFHARPDDDASLAAYLRYGGLPFLRNVSLTDAVVFEYLSGVANTALLADVVARHQIRNPDLLTRLVLFLADNVGSPVSAQSVVRFLKSQRTSASVPTILAHLSQLAQAFLIRCVRRSDLEGKRFFEVAEKHYFEDLGLRAALRGSRPEDVGKVVENAVFNRLVVDGWQVTTGFSGDKEIDFVCVRGTERAYVQATYLMPESTTRAREFGNLLSIRDNHPKYVVSLDPFQSDERGVRHLALRAFLRDGLPG